MARRRTTSTPVANLTAIGPTTEAANASFARYVAERNAHEAQFAGMPRGERPALGLIARVGEEKPARCCAPVCLSYKTKASRKKLKNGNLLQSLLT